MIDFIYDEMIAVDADGVDFVPIWLDDMHPAPILCSYKKDEWKNVNSYPRSNRLYWKLDENGNKQYVR